MAVTETQVRVSATVHLHVTVTNTGTQPLTGVTISVEHAPMLRGDAPFTLADGRPDRGLHGDDVATGDVPMFRSSGCRRDCRGDHAGGVRSPPGLVATPPTLAVADAPGCAIVTGGAVRCWGLGTDGRLGYGERASIRDNDAEVGGPGEPGRRPDGGGHRRRGSHLCAGGQRLGALLPVSAPTASWATGTRQASATTRRRVGPVNLGAAGQRWPSPPASTPRAPCSTTARYAAGAEAFGPLGTPQRRRR